MITIHTFTNAYSSWQHGQIPLRLVQDQAAVLIGLCRNTYRPIADALEITDADIEWLLQQPEAIQGYTELLGGYVYVCETVADLQQVQGCDFEFGRIHGRWPNITEVPLAFDDCRFLQDNSGEAQWALLLTCWNDAGGSVYFLPRHLWKAARIDEHMALTNTVWQGALS